jgi:hypothetical protein
MTLIDYDAYAEMVVSMAAWARNHENLYFSLFAPFNETDFGFPEGPRLSSVSAVPALRCVETLFCLLC